MAEIAPFSLRLTGGTADVHQFQGYDGYMSLAGFAWMLSLIANYVETGHIRHRGDFEGRHAVRATTPRDGSIIADFFVAFASSPHMVFGAAGLGSASALMYALTKRVVGRNLGHEVESVEELIARLGMKRAGDVEALTAMSESPIRQAHTVIGNGAESIDIIGGTNLVNRFNRGTKEYVKADVRDDRVICKLVNVSSFNANSGYGSVFDFDLGRNVPITMSKEILLETAPVFSWGLDQYARRANKQVNVCFRRILALDDRPKRYVVVSANVP